MLLLFLTCVVLNVIFSVLQEWPSPLEKRSGFLCLASFLWWLLALIVSFSLHWGCCFFGGFKLAVSWGLAFAVVIIVGIAFRVWCFLHFH